LWLFTSFYLRYYAPKKYCGYTPIKTKSSDGSEDDLEPYTDEDDDQELQGPLWQAQSAAKALIPRVQVSTEDEEDQSSTLSGMGDVNGLVQQGPADSLLTSASSSKSSGCESSSQSGTPAPMLEVRYPIQTVPSSY